MVVAAIADSASPFLRLFRPGLGFYILLGAAALLAAFFLLFFLTALAERQQLSGSVESATDLSNYPRSAYWQETRDEAVRRGLRHAGDFVTRKGTSVVKGVGSLFVTQDAQVIVAISSSSVAGAKLKKTVLRSKLGSGRVLESSDNPGVDDFSGVIDRVVLLNAGIGELLDFHLQRLQRAGSPALAFNPAAVLSDYEKIDLEKGGRWVLLGLARWVDPQQTSIRMTFRGALAQVKHLIRQTGKLQAQSHRSHIRRAGASRPR